MNTSLGYYINPLFNVVLGVILFKEGSIDTQKAECPYRYHRHRLTHPIRVGSFAISIDDPRRFLRSLWGCKETAHLSFTSIAFEGLAINTASLTIYDNGR